MQKIYDYFWINLNVICIHFKRFNRHRPALAQKLTVKEKWIDFEFKLELSLKNHYLKRHTLNPDMLSAVCKNTDT